MGKTRISVRLVGQAKTRAAMLRLAGVGRQVAEDVLQAWTDEVGDHAEAVVPVDTHHLEQSIERRPNTQTLKSEVGVWDQKAAKYAEHVETGTSAMDAQPYLLPAFEIGREKIDHFAETALRRHLP